MCDVNMSCAVKDCYSNYHSNDRDSTTITFHRFPKAFHKIWLKLAGLSSDNWKWKPNQKICSKHFQEDCFDRSGQTVRLHKDAMPTLLLPNNDVQKVEHADPHLHPQSTCLPKFSENIDYSISTLDASNSTKNSGSMEKFVPVSTNESGFSSLSTVITIISTSEPDIKTEPLSMDIKQENELDAASPNLYHEISVKSPLKSHADDIKTEISTEIDVTDYSIYNIYNVKSKPTMEVDSDRAAMSCDHFPSFVKVVDSDSSTITAHSTMPLKAENSLIQDEASGDSDHNSIRMVPIKDEPPDCVSIPYNEDLKQLRLGRNFSNIGKPLCKFCQTYFADWLSLERHLENCYRRVCGQIFASDYTLTEHALIHETQHTTTDKIIISKQRKKSKWHTCRFCKMSYKFPAELRKHVMAHITVKHYLCIYCGDKFNPSHRSKCKQTHSQHGRKHINKKTNNKARDNLKPQPRFGCSVCRKSYCRQKSLMNHKCKRIHTGEKPYQCSHCSKRFAIRSELNTHNRIHTGEKPYECSYCKKHFTRLGGLKMHERIHTDEKSYKCSYCSKRCASQAHLTTHERIHTGEKPYECSYCKKRFNQQGALTVHERIHTGEKHYQCLHCNKRFNRRGGLKSHILIHTSEKPYECSHCSKRFAGRSQLNRHKRIHTGEKPYECSYCKKRYAQLYNLKEHESTHTGEKHYQCLHCNKRFNDTIGLKSHILIHTGAYQCSHCSKRFGGKKDLNRHNRIHTGEKPYECSYCKKRFTRVDNLKTHERIHTGGKPYQCLHCNKSFNHSISLKSHILTHTGEKPYECSHCSKHFNQHGTLTLHERIHTGEKPYQCSDCSKRFAVQRDLNRHQRIHAGEKPYQCSYCKNRFNRVDYLKKHERIHTGEKPYQCLHCNKRYITSHSLKRHILTHTPE